MNYILIFVAMFATDVCWAIYVKHTASASAFQSSLWAMGLLLTGAIGNIGYNADHWMLIPATIGAGLGTYAGVRWADAAAAWVRQRFINALLRFALWQERTRPE